MNLFILNSIVLSSVLFLMIIMMFLINKIFVYLKVKTREKQQRIEYREILINITQ
jgi:hypothetical protein